MVPALPRRTFSDQIASIARPFARRTSRVGEIVGLLGHATGGRPAERLLHRLGLGKRWSVVRRSTPNSGQIERWHQTKKNKGLLENYCFPGDLERQIGPSSNITTTSVTL